MSQSIRSLMCQFYATAPVRPFFLRAISTSTAVVTITNSRSFSCTPPFHAALLFIFFSRREQLTSSRRFWGFFVPVVPLLSTPPRLVPNPPLEHSPPASARNSILFSFFASSCFSRSALSLLQVEFASPYSVVPPHFLFGFFGYFSFSYQSALWDPPSRSGCFLSSSPFTHWSLPRKFTFVKCAGAKP